MAQTLFFGVELEFHVGFLWDTNISAPESAAGRTIRFDSDQTQLLMPSPPSLPENSLLFDPFEQYWTSAKKKSVYEHIADTLTAEGLPMFVHSSRVGRPHLANEWVIGAECLGIPDVVPYLWIPCELTSPALPFDEHSVSKISSVWNLLQRRYVIHCGSDCGLHIHVSGGHNPPKLLDFRTMQNLFAFLWAFEPLLDTIHPEERQTSSYCKSWRRNSKLAAPVKQEGYATPLVARGMSKIMGANTYKELFSLIVFDQYNKNLAYNVHPAERFERYTSATCIPTIEFRQHRGTLDAVQVVSWIKLVLGIVSYCQGVKKVELESLLLKVQQNETIDDNTSQDNHIEAGANQDSFAIVDLLRYISLDDLASHYKGCTYPFVEYALRPGSSRKPGFYPGPAS